MLKQRGMGMVNGYWEGTIRVSFLVGMMSY